MQGPHTLDIICVGQLLGKVDYFGKFLLYQSSWYTKNNFNQKFSFDWLWLLLCSAYWKLLSGDYIVLEIPNNTNFIQVIILQKCEVDSDLFSHSFIVV